MRNKILRMIDEALFISCFIKQRAPMSTPEDAPIEWEQLRSLFTAWCLRFNIDKETDTATEMIERMSNDMQADEMTQESLENYFFKYL